MFHWYHKKERRIHFSNPRFTLYYYTCYTCSTVVYVFDSITLKYNASLDCALLIKFSLVNMLENDLSLLISLLYGQSRSDSHIMRQRNRFKFKWNMDLYKGFMTVFFSILSRSAGRRSVKSVRTPVSSAPLSRQNTATIRSETISQLAARTPCPIAIRQQMLGMERQMCRCSRHFIPQIMDIEYEEFIQREVPADQLVVIQVVSSL